ncbi:hypothetical protein VULLAG_LOCUS23840 [Vulpes lagopus]
MPAAESKPLQTMVTALIPCADLERHLHPGSPGGRSGLTILYVHRSSKCRSSYLTQRSNQRPNLSNSLNHQRANPGNNCEACYTFRAGGD